MNERNIARAKSFKLKNRNNNGELTHTYVNVVFGDDKSDAVLIHSYTLCSNLKDKPAKWVRTFTFNGVTKYLMVRHMSMKLSTFKYIYENIQEYL